jgi:gamma-glutamyltranspeptidase/glutathione hydrolase
MSFAYSPASRRALHRRAAPGDARPSQVPGSLTSAPATPRYGNRHMVAAPHHLASESGLRILRRGGSAADAAIAANAVLSVVSPDMCGPGGDLFAMVWAPGEGRPLVLDSAGPAGSRATLQDVRRQWGPQIPLHGPQAATVPGALPGWAELHERFGRVPFGDLFADAVHLAADGFPCSPGLARGISRYDPGIPDLLVRGRAPQAGDQLRMTGLARALSSAAELGGRAYFAGEFAARLSRMPGVLFQERDFTDYEPRWVEPLKASVFGLDVWTLPPPSQGYLTLVAARILDGLHAPCAPDDPDQWHLMVESLKAAAHDRDRLLGDDRSAVERVLGEREISRRRRLVTDRASSVASLHAAGDTVYLCAVDSHGFGVSLIQSLFHPWGSRVHVPELGTSLQNRGASFSLEEGHANAYQPGRRARSTLSPTVITKDGALRGLLGTMGGDVQPQTNLQNLVRHAVSGLDPAEALNYPRFYLNRGLAPSIWSDQEPLLGVEGRTPPHVVEELSRRGHEVKVGSDYSDGAGHAQFIAVDGSRLLGAADPRSGSGGVATE